MLTQLLFNLEFIQISIINITAITSHLPRSHRGRSAEPGGGGLFCSREDSS